ncbi:hypothetical protein [Actinoplanes sp. NPDC049316]|uniref:hypothetical protein n=1 Tax=Actinoplanes sp. NPDC049316 TaxID=3154727 RepID=UPI00343A62ED
MFIRHSLLATLTTAFLAGVSAAAPAPGAVRSLPPAPIAARSGWSTPVTVLEPPCAPDFSTATAAVGPRGELHGFAAFSGGTCADAGMWYFHGSGRRWSREPSPYRGDVLATAADRTGAWVLFLGGNGYDQVRLGRRSAAGAWSAPRTLSRLEGSAVASGVQGASLVASGGRWWAVWAQALPDPQSSAPATTLFQAKTIGGALSARRITAASPAQQESRPSLALRTGRSGAPAGAMLVWSRDIAGAVTGVQNDELRYGAATPDGRWSQRVSVPAAPEPAAVSPVIATSGPRTWVAWRRLGMAVDEEPDSAVLVGAPAAGPRTVRVFPGAGSEPVFAAAPGRLAAAWSAPDRAAAVVASRAAGRWTVRTIGAGPDARGVRPIGVALTGHATTLLVQVRSAGGRISALTGR